jgi:hypothetical protein
VLETSRRENLTRSPRGESDIKKTLICRPKRVDKLQCGLMSVSSWVLIRTEWRVTDLFLSVNKKRNYYYYFLTTLWLSGTWCDKVVVVGGGYQKDNSWIKSTWLGLVMCVHFEIFITFTVHHSSIENFFFNTRMSFFPLPSLLFFFLIKSHCKQTDRAFVMRDEGVHFGKSKISFQLLNHTWPVSCCSTLWYV